MIQLKSILLPTDFSETALAATRYGLEFARRFNATVHLLHVIEDPVVYLPMFESYPLPSRGDFENYAQTALDNWIVDQDVSGITIKRSWVHGSPFVEILRYAREKECDLIIVGTHGRGFTAHLLLGSVAEKIIRKAPCPVLTVRPEGHQFIHPMDEER